MNIISSTERGRVGRALVTMAAFVIVVAGLRAAHTIVTPLLLAAFLTVICFPPLAWLIRKGVPEWLSQLIVVVCSILIVLTVVGLIGESLASFSKQLPEFQKRLLEERHALTTWAGKHGMNLDEETSLKSLHPDRLMGFATTVLGTLGSLSSDMVLVLLIFVFLLVEVSGIRGKLQAMPGYTPADDERVGKIFEDIRHYLAIKTQVSLLTAFLITAWLMFLGVDFAVLWGILAFLFNFVPNIGAVIAAIPAILLALMQLGPLTALYSGLGYLVLNGVIGGIIEPRMMGHGLQLSTLVVFLSLVFWGWVLGPVGMVLSVPLTILVRIALERSEETRWLAVLLAADPPTED